MKWFKDGRLSARTTIGMALGGSAALLLVGGAFVINDFLQFRTIVQHELSTAANVVATGSATALSFEDGDAASRALSVLGNDESIAAAALYLRDGVRPLASYSRRGANIVPLAARSQPGIYRQGMSILLIQHVVLNGQVVGTLAIRAGINALTSLLPRDLDVAALMITCIVMGFLCTLPLPWSMVQPAMAMAETVWGNPLDGPRLRFDGTNASMEPAGVPPPHVQDREMTSRNDLPEQELPARIAVLEESNAELILAKTRAVEVARLKHSYERRDCDGRIGARN
jgi:hypothetical protein